MKAKGEKMVIKKVPNLYYCYRLCGVNNFSKATLDLPPLFHYSRQQ
jgi:hypothetical protein